MVVVEDVPLRPAPNFLVVHGGWQDSWWWQDSRWRQDSLWRRALRTRGVRLGPTGI